MHNGCKQKAMLRRLAKGLQTVDNITKGFVSFMNVRQHLWKACKPTKHLSDALKVLYQCGG
jgi:hypothetical protein